VVKSAQAAQHQLVLQVLAAQALSSQQVLAFITQAVAVVVLMHQAAVQQQELVAQAAVVLVDLLTLQFPPMVQLAQRIKAAVVAHLTRQVLQAQAVRA
jgi:hypothetical protein